MERFSRITLAFVVITLVTSPLYAADCYTCAYFTGLAEIKTSFSQNIFNALAPKMAFIVQNLFVVSILFNTGRCMISGNHQNLLGFTVKACAGFLVGYICLKTSYGVPPIYDYLLNPIENLSLGIGQIILGAATGASNPDVQSAINNAVSDANYANLVTAVEAQIRSIFSIVGHIIKLGKGNSLNPIANNMNFIIYAIAAAVLALPYLFVMGIWCAFLVEAMFKFVAVGIFAPVAIICAIFSPTRSFATATIRIAVGAGLTIIFACGALSFSLSVVDHYITDFDRNFTQSASAPVNYCDYVNNPSEQNCVDPADAKAEGPGPLDVFCPAYFAMLIIGFCSILLHLSAKTLASNISGANDGPGPAAAVVAGAKATIGAGIGAAMYMTSKTHGGINNLLNSGGNNRPDLNSPTSLLGSMLNSGGNNGGGDGFGTGGRGSGPRYSGGGGMGQSMPPDMAKSLGDINKNLGNLTKLLDPNQRER